MKSSHPEKICKKGLYEKDMLVWVDFNDLKKFNKNVRPWYKKVVKLLIKYGLLRMRLLAANLLPLSRVLAVL